MWCSVLCDTLSGTTSRFVLSAGCVTWQIVGGLQLVLAIVCSFCLHALDTVLFAAIILHACAVAVRSAAFACVLHAPILLSMPFFLVV